MTQILRFEMNVPTEVTLKHAGPGKPIEGRYGNRVMYTLADDRVMYVAPIVATQISDLGIQPGERFHVCKQLKRHGSLRLIEWDVQRLAADPETQLERELRESIAAAQATKATQLSEPNDDSNPQSPPATKEQIAQPGKPMIAAAVTVSNGPGNGNGASATQNGTGAPQIVSSDWASPAMPLETPTPPLPSSNGTANGSPSCTTKNGNNPSAPPPVTTKLEYALKTAISAAYNAEKFGADLGYVVRFDADAIKSMAITVLINMSEGNRR